MGTDERDRTKRSEDLDELDRNKRSDGDVEAHAMKRRDDGTVKEPEDSEPDVEAHGRIR
jgi:hypothetical protein